jgi:hypothetical protein
MKHRIYSMLLIAKAALQILLKAVDLGLALFKPGPNPATA